MLIKALTNKKNIETAFTSAIEERLNSEHVCFPSEVTYAKANKEEIIASIERIFLNPENFEPELGFYYTMPKSDLVSRQLVYLPITELVIHYCYAQVLAERLDAQLQGTCFANRFERDRNSERLSENFATSSWPAYCEWQKRSASNNLMMVKTDISSFFDNVDCSLLVEKVASRLSTSVSNPFFVIFKKLIMAPAHLYSSHCQYQRNKGLVTGPLSMGVLANYYLMDIDDAISNLEGIEYGRYVDDIKIFSNDKKQLKKAFSKLQDLLHLLGLNVNTTKTALLSKHEQVIELVKQEITVASNYSGEEEVRLTKLVDKIKGEELELDERFELRDNTFDRDAPLENANDAKRYCFALNDIDADEWSVDDVATLSQILQRYPQSSRHACWLMICALFSDDTEVQNTAERFITDSMWNNENIHDYAKARIIHHLVKYRYNGDSYLERNKHAFLESKFFNSIIEIICKNGANDITLLRCYAFEAFFQMKPNVSKAHFCNILKAQNVRLNGTEEQIMSFALRPQLKNQDIFEVLGISSD
ncbi:reverse transcriptase domain-containing protein [Paraferrimonas haliotis]|uniref:reverse transcriptase domain-containing protein n=1 Tax=Paraferrimonas haliotis TaxID=2013866 RepID=UPI000BA9ABE6|nr:reverse transcriptase domain-containing protein [Paraferrimonas haliotis]